ncbi:hypothetical protein [Methylobacterium sp. J-076]|uniref:hypothetical protein n=1 Tax=Methylobacterium sp. J-076 TaxID=2836655 RepID=UPI001FBB54DB|nr:hypothetical protein [Methylobacterium sp. J-076]MCJ2012147.1 hypothetical protein [Methylobacterium sp. J-076]
MTHARTTLPTMSPVHVAIAAHRAAYDAFQIAPEGEASERAETAYDEASMAVVAVACTTTPEALALFQHLAWWVLDEAEFAAGHQPAYDIAMARAKDLSLYLGTLTGPAPIPQAAPSGRLAAYFPRRSVPVIDLRSRVSADAPEDEETPGAIRGWEAVTPVRPDTPHVRALRFLDLTGEALTALAIIAGGIAAYGYLPLV